MGRGGQGFCRCEVRGARCEVRLRSEACAVATSRDVPCGNGISGSARALVIAKHSRAGYRSVQHLHAALELRARQLPPRKSADGRVPSLDIWGRGGWGDSDWACGSLARCRLGQSDQKGQTAGHNPPWCTAMAPAAARTEPRVGGQSGQPPHRTYQVRPMAAINLSLRHLPDPVGLGSQ